jgi:hypothetical protein
MRQNLTKVKRGKVLLNTPQPDGRNLTTILGDIKAKTKERGWKATGEGL